MTEEIKKEPDKVGEKQDGRKRTQFKKGQSGNPAGKKKGTLSFKTIFEKAIKKIAEESDIKECDIEVDLVIGAIAKAKGGSYSYYKDIFDRNYGMPKATVQLGLDEDIEGNKVEIIKNKDDSKPAGNSGVSEKLE